MEALARDSLVSRPPPPPQWQQQQQQQQRERLEQRQREERQCRQQQVQLQEHRSGELPRGTAAEVAALCGPLDADLAQALAPPADWPDTLEAWCTSFEREDLEKEARRQQLQRARCGGGPSAAWLRHEAAERRVFLRLGERRCDDSGGGELADSWPRGAACGIVGVGRGGGRR